MSKPEGRTEVLFEMVQLGNVVRVTAIDPESGTEVVLVGPAQASPFTLKANAMRKLKAAIEKKKPAGGR